MFVPVTAATPTRIRLRSMLRRLRTFTAWTGTLLCVLIAGFGSPSAGDELTHDPRMR